MTFFKAAALFGILILLGPLAPRAQAWNATGHMVVASIAYDQLSPRTKAAVDALLAQHRDYPLWMRDLPAGYTDRARYAFMKAATWPDDIRKTPDDRPIWHYVDVPVIAPGYTPDPVALLPVKPNAETQIVEETRLLSNASASDADRAIALCWVEHLIGDVHQPLHDSSLFSPVFPKGDKGGNSETLTPGALDADPILKALDPRHFPKNLHAVWDDLLGDKRNPAQVQASATALEGKHSRAEFPQIAQHTDAHSWVLEGNALAAKDVYRNGSLLLAPEPGGKRAVVMLPAGYLDAAHALADRQIVLAGDRLADTLNALSFPPIMPVRAITKTTSPITP